MKFSLNYTQHGGGCCGIYHLYGFDEVDLDDPWGEPKGTEITFSDKIEVINYYLNIITADHGAPYGSEKHLCIEVVLANFQWKEWERAIQRCGFKKKLEFLNSNSQNQCRIYLLAVNQSKPVKQKPIF